MANGLIQWKGNHQSRLCVKTADNSKNSCWFCSNNLAFMGRLDERNLRFFFSWKAKLVCFKMSLSKHNGNAMKNVFCDYSFPFMMCDMEEVFYGILKNGFEVKKRE